MTIVVILAAAWILSSVPFALCLGAACASPNRRLENRQRKLTARVFRTIDRLPDGPVEVVETLAVGWPPRRIKDWLLAPSVRVPGSSRSEAWTAGFHEMVLREVEDACRRWRDRPLVELAESSGDVIAQFELQFRGSTPNHSAL